MKNIVTLLLVVLAFGLFTACDDEASNVKVTEPIEVVKEFFSTFENANYEKMKDFCTQEGINLYFHEGDVFGMSWAKAVEFEEVKKNLSENESAIFTHVEMETVKTSALYGETKTSFYVILEEQGDGSWLIDKFVNGL